MQHGSGEVGGMKQKLTELKEETKIHNYSWGVQHNTDRTTGEKISKDIEELKNIINQQDLIGMHRTLH